MTIRRGRIGGPRLTDEEKLTEAQEQAAHNMAIELEVEPQFIEVFERDVVDALRNIETVEESLRPIEGDEERDGAAWVADVACALGEHMLDYIGYQGLQRAMWNALVHYEQDTRGLAV